MSEVVMYSTRFCPYCTSAERLLSAKGVAIRTISVDSEPGLWEEMQNITGRSTVPQIFISEEHVGGYDDLAALERAGKLDTMLAPVLNEIQR